MSYGFFKAFRWLCGYILIPLPFFFGCSVWLCLFPLPVSLAAVAPVLTFYPAGSRSDRCTLRICAMRPVCAVRTLLQLLNGLHSRLVVVKETMDAFITAQRSDCFGKVGSRVQYDVVLPVKFGTVGTPFQPQGEEREVVHESLEDVACLLRLRLSYMGDVLRCYASLEMLVAYLVSSRTVGEAYSIVWGFPGQIADLPAFSFASSVFIPLCRR